MNEKSNNSNYSEILRLRSQELYSKSNSPKMAFSETLFNPILRSNSSLSLDQKKSSKMGSKLTSNSNNNSFLDFKQIQELRECRTTTASSMTSTTASSAVSSLKKCSSQSLSNENLNKSQMKSKFKSKLFFSKKEKLIKNNFNKSEEKLIECEFEAKEELRRRHRFRQHFIHYDIQSTFALNDIFEPKTTTATTTTSSSSATQSLNDTDVDDNDGDDSYIESEFNSNSLLGFSSNFRNEIGKELVFGLHLNEEIEEEVNSRRSHQRFKPNMSQRVIHTSALCRQMSCLSSFDFPSQSLSSTQSFCPFDTKNDFNSNVLEIDFGINYYRKYFYGFSHQNWFQVFEEEINEKKVKTIIALSLRKEYSNSNSNNVESNRKLRIICRSNHCLRSLKGFLSLNNEIMNGNGNNGTEMNLKSIFELIFPKKYTKNENFLNNFRLGFDSKSDELLLKLDEEFKESEEKNRKIGILYACRGQSTEEEFYNNRDVDDNEFHDFLSLIGERIRLKDYKGFRGGLDTRTDTTGLYSYSTKFGQPLFGQFDIMFHVLTELPYMASNAQQLLRKRHIGNDIVTIVFQSRDFHGPPFDPSLIRSHFQHIFIIVRPAIGPGGRGGYRVAVARHKSCPPFGPPLKPFYSKLELKDFLLTKIINAENHCHKVNKFKQMALRTRFEYLNELFINFSSNLTLNSFQLNSNSNHSIISSNFNQFFSQIFAKKPEKEFQPEVNNSSLTSGTHLRSRELIFGAKVFEIISKNPKKRLFISDVIYGQKEMEIKVLLTQKMLFILDSSEKRLIFCLNFNQILGYFFDKNPQKSENSLKFFLHFGEFLVIREDLTENSVLFELKENLNFLLMNEMKENSKEMKEILLKRNSLIKENSFGFHLCQTNHPTSQSFSSNSRLNDNAVLKNDKKSSEVIITEVNEWAREVNHLVKGQRILEICKISCNTLSYEQILDILKTSQTVSVAVVEPAKDGSPRRGCFHPNSCLMKRKNEFFFQSNNNSVGDYENVIPNVFDVNRVQRVTPSSTARDAKEVSDSVKAREQQMQTCTRRAATRHVSQRQRERQPPPLCATSRAAHPTQTSSLHNNHLLSTNCHSSTSASSTTSSTLQEDLIKLLTTDVSYNDCDAIDDDEDDNQLSNIEMTNDANTSLSSSRYSTATSTPYSSLERRKPFLDFNDKKEDAVVTVVAKPAFVINSDLTRHLRRHKTTADAVNTIADNENDCDDDCVADIQWPSLLSSKKSQKVNSSSEIVLKEKVEELTEEKLVLNETIRQLKEENQRLHFESQTASQQLRKFTEWFFNSSNH